MSTLYHCRPGESFRFRGHEILVSDKPVKHHFPACWPEKDQDNGQIMARVVFPLRGGGEFSGLVDPRLEEEMQALWGVFEVEGLFNRIQWAEDARYWPTEKAYRSEEDIKRDIHEAGEEMDRLCGVIRSAQEDIRALNGRSDALWRELDVVRRAKG